MRWLREKFGFGIMDARRAREIADERFDGDIELGGWWVSASALAVYVKGGPEGRAAWNDAFALTRADRKALAMPDTA